MNRLTRKVLTHYLETGEPLKVKGIIVGTDSDSGIEDCEPIGVWSAWAEPKYGWEPSKDLLRRELCRAQGKAIEVKR